MITTNWPGRVDISQKTMERILYDAGINDKIVAIGDPVTCIMQSYKITLEDNKTVFLQFGINDEWTDNAIILTRVNATKMLEQIVFPSIDTVLPSTRI